MATTTTTTVQGMRVEKPSPYPVPDIPESYWERLDPDWVSLWEEHGSKVERADLVTIEEVRRNASKYSFTYPTYPGPPVHSVRDYKVPVENPSGEVNVRVYSPEGAGPFPVHLNFHGGGWVLGGLHSEASWCRHVCNEAKIKVIDVDYRLAPEYRFPVSIYDCWTAVRWAISNAAELDIDGSSVSIGGLSAGGQMSAVLSHFARDEGIDLKLQLLIVPAIDMRYCLLDEKLDEQNCAFQSAIDLQDAPWSPLGREQWFLKYWVGDDREQALKTLDDWRCTPALATRLDNLAPAHVVTAELDLERDEGEWYAERLRNAGNKVSCKRYLGVPHAFGHYNHPERGLLKSFEFIRDTCEVLRTVHASENQGT